MDYEILSVGSDANNNGTNGNLSTEPEKTADTPAGTDGSSTPAAVENPPETTTTDVDPEGDDGAKPDEIPETAPEYFFAGEQVEVAIPDDIQSAFAEKGIDGNLVLTELFAKEGKFELSADTKAKLDEAFGKPLVDGYLGLFKQQNDMALKQFKSDADAQTKLHEQITSDFGELVGGDAGWGELDSWAAENMSETELASFNAVMQLPPEHWQAQRAVIEAAQIRRGAAVQKVEGTGMGALIGDEGSAGSRGSEGVPGTLTMAEFQNLMGTEKYRTDPQYAARVDAVRRTSKQNGIA